MIQEGAPTRSSMPCRVGCAACCIAPSISSPIPDMPGGKGAGVRCVQLTPENRCRLFGKPDRPKVCVSLQPVLEMCGRKDDEAMAHLTELERITRPSVPPATTRRSFCKEKRSS